MKFDYQIERSGVDSVVSMSGVFDEDADFDSLLRELEGSANLRLDLGEVERVNDSGAQAFEEFLRGKDTVVTLIECSPAVVAKLETLDSELFGVESIAIPYFCPECDEPRSIKTALMAIGTPPSAPVRRCEKCDLVMHFDDDAARYFGFLGSGGSIDAASAEAPPAGKTLNPETESSPVSGAVLVLAVAVAVAVAVALLI